MDRQDRDGVGVGIELGAGRIVARLDERLQVARDEHRPIVGEQRRLGADDVEEPGDVLERLLGRGRVGLREPARASPVSRRNVVQHLAGGSLAGELRMSRRSSATRRAAASRVAWREAQDPRLALELLEHVPEHRVVPPPRRVDDRRQVVAADAVQVGRGERVDVDARATGRRRPQEREQAAGPRAVRTGPTCR